MITCKKNFIKEYNNSVNSILKYFENYKKKKKKDKKQIVEPQTEVEADASTVEQPDAGCGGGGRRVCGDVENDGARAVLKKLLKDR